MDLELGKQRITVHIKRNWNKNKSLPPHQATKESSAMFPAHVFAG